jgi:hypothetical protein
MAAAVPGTAPPAAARWRSIILRRISRMRIWAIQFWFIIWFM